MTKTLLISLVRPILDGPKKNFLLFALRRLKWDANRILPPYSSRLLLINFMSLANRRTMLGTVFICKLIRGLIFRFKVDSLETIYPLS